MSDEHRANESKSKVEWALGASHIPKFYFNGFVTFRGNSDMGALLQLNAQPVAVLNMSFTMAKTLAHKLSRMVQEYEELTGTEVMTTDGVDARTSQGRSDDHNLQ